MNRLLGLSEISTTLKAEITSQDGGQPQVLMDRSVALVDS